MPDVLDEIIANKKAELKKAKQEVSISRLWEAVAEQPPPKEFVGVLNNPECVSVIAEIKKTSPSAGIIRHDFEPLAIARAYESAGAAAISVLTDERFFGGSLKVLKQVRAQVALPLLRKDFVLDPYQLIEARACGADAVLLIIGALDKSQCAELRDAALELRLSALAEVHNFRELEAAMSCEFQTIGINNRDLRTFEVDLAATELVIREVPADVLVVSESGIKNRADVERLGKAGVDAVLVGETLMRQSDVGSALDELIGVTKWSR
ncbi:MAG: indole-3-glycerol phosphate synthase TrpC [bacterium]